MYEVWVEKLADLGEVPGPEVFWMGAFDQWLPLSIHGLIIRGEGRTILVNTGPPVDYLEHMNAVWREELGPRSQMRVDPEMRIEAVLDRHRIRPEAVDCVIVTPLQAYAIGNVDRFPNAEICISRTGWIDLFAPRFFDPRRHMAVPDRILAHLLFDAWPARRVRLVDDEAIICPGLSTFWTGTHHRSSMAVVVETPQGRVGFADAVFYYANLEQDRPLGIQESMEECRVAYERLRREVDRFVSPYDPDTARRFPGGRVAVIGPRTDRTEYK